MADVELASSGPKHEGDKAGGFESASAEERLQIIADSMAVGIAHCSRDKRYLWVSKCYAEWLHRPAEEVSGRPMIEVIGERAYRMILPYVEQALAGKQVSFEAEINYEGTAHRWVNAIYTPVRRAGSTPEGWVAVVTDITRRKQLEDELREKEQRLNFALQAAELSQWSLDLKTHEIIRSSRFDQIFGYTSPLPSFTYDLFLQHILPEHRDHLERQLRKSIAQAGAWECETRIKRSDETVRWIEVKARVAYDKSGNPAQLIGIMSDITSRKSYELQFQERDQQLNAVLDVLPVGLFIADAGGNLVKSNPAADVIWGAATPKVPVEQYREYKARRPGSDRHLTDLEWALARALRTGEIVINEELEIETFDGKKKVILNSALPVRNVEGKISGAVAMNQDITEQKAAERALIRAEKLASVGRMAATIAHEMNNPLAAAMNALFLVRTDPALPDALKGNLGLAEQELARVAHIAKQTLGFYREIGTQTAVSVASVLESILNLYRPRLKAKGISVHRRFRTHASVRAVEGEIHQIVSNIVANSIDATSANGSLMLRLYEPQVLRGNRRMIRLTIADNGVGIEKANLERVFEPFFTTKSTIGTGLGLWVTSELVRKQEGRIRLRSRSGKGTVVQIWLPVERRDQQRRTS